MTDTIREAVPQVVPDWRPGLRYRVTSTDGGHGFPVGTIVYSMTRDGHDTHDHFLATRYEDWEEERGWDEGNVAYVGFNCEGDCNVEYVGEPAPEWAPGAAFRVTGDSNYSRFPVGTIVWALLSPNDHENRNSITEFHATTLDLDDYTQGSPQTPLAVTRYVRGRDLERVPEHDRIPPSHGGTPPEPEDVLPCTETGGHPRRRIHEHWRFVGRPVGDTTVYSAAVGWVPNPVNASNWQKVDGQFTRDPERLPSHSVKVEPEPVVRSVDDLDLPPEEVVRIIRANPRLSMVMFDEALLIERLMEQIAEKRTAVTERRQERAIWVDEAIETSRRYAEDHDWCDVYDNTMERLGLPRREARTDTVTVTGFITVTTSVDSEDAESVFRDRYDAEDFTDSEGDGTISVDIELTREEEVDEGECACFEERSRWTDYLPAWITDNGLDWTLRREDCSND